MTLLFPSKTGILCRCSTAGEVVMTYNTPSPMEVSASMPLEPLRCCTDALSICLGAAEATKEESAALQTTIYLQLARKLALDFTGS